MNTNVSTFTYIINQLRLHGSVFVPNFAYEAMTASQQQAVQAVRAIVDGSIYCL